MKSMARYLHLVTRKLRHCTRFRCSKSFVVAFLCLLLLFLHFRSNGSGKRTTSIVECKADIAELAIPNDQKREKYLSVVGADYKAIEEEFFYFITKLTTSCGGQEHLGPPEEGGYDICLGRRFDIRAPCLIYSFGVGYDFGFEKDAERILGCEIHSFDPSMNMESRDISDKIHFHNYGIDNVETIDTTTGWKMKKLSTIIKELDHEEHHIDIFKMDVEFSEWLVLHDLVDSGHLPRIRQLVLEIHTPEVDVHDRPGDRCSSTGPNALRFMLRTLLDLRNEGFSLFGSRTNHRTMYISKITGKERYCCHNLHFVNTKHTANQL